MVDIVSLESVTASVGDVAGALALLTECVGTTVDSLAVESGGAGSALDRNMTGKLEWIRETFAAAAGQVTEQSDTTVRATDYGTTTLNNADIDGAGVVRSAAV